MRRWLKDNWPELLIGAGILLASLIMRWRYMELNPMLYRDSALYCHIATAWSQLGDFGRASENFGGTAPLYVYLLRIGVDLGFPVVKWGRFLSFFFGGAFVLAFYFLGKQLFPGRRDGALIFMFLAGMHPVIGRLSVALLREGPFLALAAFAMVAFVSAFKSGGVKAAVTCGVLLGAASLARHEALELLLLGAAALLPWRRKGDPGANDAEARPDADAKLRLTAKLKTLLRGSLPSFSMLGAAAASTVAILLISGMPLSFMVYQYWSKLDKVKF